MSERLGGAKSLSTSWRTFRRIFGYVAYPAFLKREIVFSTPLVMPPTGSRAPNNRGRSLSPALCCVAGYG